MIYANTTKEGGMSKKKVAGIVVGSIVGAIVIVIAIIAAIASCADFVSSPNDSPSPTVTVDYEVIVLYGSAYLRVRVEGPQDSYEVRLFDPAGESVGYGFISSDDMLTGHETVEVSMTDTGVTNPAPGEYWLIVNEWLPEKRVFEAKPVFEGPDVSITDVQFETTYYAYFDEGSITDATVQVHNSGDLPVRADEMRVLVAGEQDDSTVYETLPPGQTTVLEPFVYISELDGGTHPVTVEIYSEGAKLASYATQITIG